ncbi:hypothetical protein F5Y07DRAFT_380529 [Xylaria sp. FL0933]|nr:hypothetical protein F5Y07DRAFT_380529 [Xylaria sp. FL0933]
MESSPLLDLPFELIRQICAQLLNGCLFHDIRIYDDLNVVSDCRRGLARLSRSCKVLHSMVAPFLSQLRRTSPLPETLRVYLVRYARDILRDPGLAAREGFFRLSYCYPFLWVEEGDAEILDTAAHRLGRPPPSRWLVSGSEVYSREQISELLVLVLVNLPNLSILQLKNEFDLSQLPPQSLLSLKKAQLNSAYIPLCELGCKLDDMRDFAPFFHTAPFLERLYLNNCTGCSEPLQLVNLRSIHLGNSLLSPEAIRNLLAGCVKLEKFMYRSVETDVDLNEQWYRNRYEAQPSDFVAALLPARSTLQELRITTTPEMREHFTRIEDGTITIDEVHPEELKHFTALRIVAILHNWISSVHSSARERQAISFTPIRYGHFCLDEDCNHDEDMDLAEQVRAEKVKLMPTWVRVSG